MEAQSDSYNKIMEYLYLTCACYDSHLANTNTIRPKKFFELFNPFITDDPEGAMPASITQKCHDLKTLILTYVLVVKKLRGFFNGMIQL